MEALSPSETSEQPVLTESQQSATPSGTQRDADRPTSPQTDANVMDPDDPILARTQAALKRQLEASQLRLQGEVREKAKLLSDAKKHREATGVDLFNFQQQLARLQMDLEKAHDHHTSIAAAKEAAEARVRGLRAQHDDELRAVKDERVRTDKFQEELDRCAPLLPPPPLPPLPASLGPMQRAYKLPLRQQRPRRRHSEHGDPAQGQTGGPA